MQIRGTLNSEARSISLRCLDFDRFCGKKLSKRPQRVRVRAQKYHILNLTVV